MTFLLAELAKQPQKFDCLKTPMVLQLEALQFTPFHILSLALFIFAIVHTLSVNHINRLARCLEMKQAPQREKLQKKERSLPVQFLYFLSEVEIVFAFWAIPLFLVMSISYSWTIALEYFNTRDYTEPLFVAVILSLTATRPILAVSESAIRWCAKWLGGSLSAWWFVLLTLGPILGSLITEVGAMTLCALLLSKQFYEFSPSRNLSYATLALLFVNISVGGILTDFASPAVLVLAHCWHWTTADMFLDFGWKAALGIFIANSIYWFIFRKEFQLLDEKKRSLKIASSSSTENIPDLPIPKWITIIHVFFIAMIVVVSHYPAIFIAIFFFFIGFHQATRAHQYPIRLVRPMLIGLFLAGLVIHGGLQGWWVIQILHNLSPLGVLGTALLMTGFNDNTAISYLSVLVPGWGDAYKYAVFTGVVAGGGLTVIANAPNPAGYAILARHFDGGIQPLRLLLGAALPTLILYLIFFLIGPLFP